MNIFWTIFTLLALCKSWALDTNTDVIVELSSGKIRGRIESIVNGKYSRQFRGIPYAEAPVGNRRFAPPEPVQTSWDGVRDATEFASICPQLPMPPPLNETTAGMTVSEDCLYLNVFTPHATCPDSKFAVMVYIHGGGFCMGNPPDDMASVLASFYDVIFVGIQYRLGIFGFLNIPGSEITGNLGLRDQIEALKWVKSNIGSFCGDPSRVTIFGESAGAVSASLLMIIPQAKNLFHRVIAQSGAADSVHTISKVQDTTPASTFLGYLDCSLGDYLQCLRTKSQEQILSAQLKLMSSATSGDLWVLIAPTVDGDLLTDVPRNLLHKNQFQGVPSIFGVNANEGSVVPTMMFTQMPLSMYTQEFFKGFIFASKNIPEGENDAIKAAILYHYTNYSVPQTPEMVRQQFMDMFGDKFATAPVILNLESLAEAGVPGYFYVFAHRSKYSIWPDYAGVNHADELPYILGNTFKSPPTLPLTTGFTEMEKGLSKFMMKLWTNFAKYGNPNQKEDGHDLVTWPKYTKQSRTFLKIGLNCEIGENYRPNEVAFWNDFLPKLATHKLLQKVKEKKSKDRKTEL